MSTYYRDANETSNGLVIIISLSDNCPGGTVVC